MRRALVIGLLLALPGCDEGRVREGASQFTDHEHAAMRVFVTPEGIGTIYEVASPDGFHLVAMEETVASAGDATVEVGPIDQRLAVRSREVDPAVGALQVSMQFRSPQIFVPVRIRDGFDVRICRYRVSGALVTTSGFVSLVETETGRGLDVTSPPVVEITSANVDAVEPCPDIAGLLTPEELAAALVDYVEAAVASSAAEALRSSPLDVIGLVRRNLQISRISAFANRQGVLAVEGITPQRPDALALTADGLIATVDATADAQRARCAPPVGLDLHQDMGTEAIDPSVVRRFGADFALAVSMSWIQRLAQAATLAGFACAGLEDARQTEQNESLIDVDDILLSEIDLGAVPVGEHVRLIVRPGSLPLVSNNASSGTIEIEWQDLQVDVYAEMFGAWSRLVTVVSDANVSLRPRSPALGSATFALETLEIEAPRADSAFLVAPPDAANLERWTQRTLLLLLQERLELPLPLDAGSSLRVLNVQVREQDLVYYLRFEG